MAPAGAEIDVEALYKMLEDYKATAQRYQERCAEANAALAEAEQAKSAALLRAQKADVERQEALDAANVASVIPDSVPALRAALEETRAQVARYKKALKEM